SQQLIPADPDVQVGYANLASSYFSLDRFPAAASALQQAAERKLESPNDLLMRYHLAVLTGDEGQRQGAAARASGKPGAEQRLAHAEALALARSGRLRAARLSSKRAVDVVRQEGESGREGAAIYQAARAGWEALCGNTAEATTVASAALTGASGRDVQYAARLALAIADGSSRSEKAAGDLEKEFPEDTFVNFTYAPVLRALVALRRGNPEEAVARLEIARRYE